MNVQARLERLMKAPSCALGERVLAEARYAYELSQIDKGKWNSLIEKATAALEKGLLESGAITTQAAASAEEMLLPMAETAKRYTVLCVGHAHIDMNWMWRYDETVSVTLDTFRTVLNLMQEYPQFTFAQSQASVYEMVEKYDPDMLDEIRRRVAEGRWELTASTWVEADRNMPSGESIARHHLYTRRYLKKLFPSATDADFEIDFEPDTFGHSANVPELLAQDGIRYYYHCRGDNDEALRRWRALSGAEVLSYREPYWYNAGVDASFAFGAPGFCERYGMDTHLRVYGVGDHGGGPTRRDIERILDMMQWPVFPRFRFGSYKEFFQKAEQARNVPVLTGERNCVFTGCYTSQARTKQANRYGEAHLDEAERFASSAALRAGIPYRNELFEEAWRSVLFNQFHDILPGSGVVDTREFAMGNFSHTLAAADTQKSKALRAWGALADTSAYLSGCGMEESISEGGGVGFGVGYGMSGVDPTLDAGAGRPFRIAQTERGRGINRVFHVFNPSAVAREEVVELTVFDWPGDYHRLKVVCGERTLPYQILDETPQSFWMHQFVRVLVQISLPAGGRATCVLTQDDEREASWLDLPHDIRTEDPFEYVLENAYLRAQFCPDTGALLSLFDKERGVELLNRPAAFFRFIQEQPMVETAGTAWSVGRTRSSAALLNDVTIVWSLRGALKNALTITAYVNDSRVQYTASLCEGAKVLEFSCDVDWRELGVPKQNTPQLDFVLPLACNPELFVHDIPGGTLSRAGRAMDAACQSFSAAPYAPGAAVMLLSDSHYGFRCENKADGCVMSVDCLRSSSDPDPYPEFGRHQFRLGIGLCAEDRLELMNTSYAFCHELSAVSDIPRAGSAPLCEEGVSCSGAFLQSIKLAEDGKALIVRLLEVHGRTSAAELSFHADIAHAEAVNAHELPLDGRQTLSVAGKKLTVELRPYTTASLKICF